MKRIALTQGKFALVDTIDFAYLNQWKWSIYKIRQTWYVKRTIHGLKHKTIYLHRVILERIGYKDFKQVDHVDGNGLNNRRKNLRPATRKQNQHNQKISIKNTSGYKGVYWNNQRKRWMAYIKLNGKQIYLGYFDNALNAAKAYNRAAKKYHKKYAKLNKV